MLHFHDMLRGVKQDIRRNGCGGIPQVLGGVRCTRRRRFRWILGF